MKRRSATKLSDIPTVFVSDDMYAVGGEFDLPLLFESYVANVDSSYIFAPCESFDVDMAGVSPSVLFECAAEAAPRFSLDDDCFIFDTAAKRVRSGNYSDFVGLLNDINPDLMGDLTAYAIEFDNPTGDPVLDELVLWWDTEGRYEFGE